MIVVGGSDQGKVGLVGDGEDDPAVGLLEYVRPVVVEQLTSHDVTAAYQPDPGRCALVDPLRPVSSAKPLRRPENSGGARVARGPGLLAALGAGALGAWLAGL